MTPPSTSQTNPHVSFLRKFGDTCGPLPSRRCSNVERELPIPGETVMTLYGLATIITNLYASFFCQLINAKDADLLRTRFIVDSDSGGSCRGNSFDDGLVNFCESLQSTIAHWADRLACHRNNPNSFVINNNAYMISKQVGGIRGFSGAAHYIITLSNTGNPQVLYTDNLWHQGYIPEAFRINSNISNNAEWLQPEHVALLNNINAEGRHHLSNCFSTKPVMSLSSFVDILKTQQRTPTP